MELTPYVCTCCGGQIDISSMKCKYCDTPYHHPSLDRVTVMRVDPGTQTLRAEVCIPRDDAISVTPKGLRDYALDELKNQLSDALLTFMKIETCHDPMRRSEIIRGEVRVVDPTFTGRFN